jgi:hypothetical protein
VDGSIVMPPTVLPRQILFCTTKYCDMATPASAEGPTPPEATIPHRPLSSDALLTMT